MSTQDKINWFQIIAILVTIVGVVSFHISIYWK